MLSRSSRQSVIWRPAVSRVPVSHSSATISDAMPNTTKMGVADLQYQGNVFVDEWTGCPDAALKKLGLA